MIECNSMDNQWKNVKIYKIFWAIYLSGAVKVSVCNPVVVNPELEDTINIWQLEPCAEDSICKENK